MTRLSARARGYDSAWDRERRAFLARPENRYCACGCGRSADTVDHHRAHKGDQRLFWDKTNWRAWNGNCHSRTKQQQERWGYDTRTGLDGLPLSHAHPFNRGA